jgi:hypothetical protein
MKIHSDFALLDVQAGRKALITKLGGGGWPKGIPVVVTGYINAMHGPDDGVSQQFSVQVTDVVLPRSDRARKAPPSRALAPAEKLSRRQARRKARVERLLGFVDIHDGATPASFLEANGVSWRDILLAIDTGAIRRTAPGRFVRAD